MDYPYTPLEEAVPTAPSPPSPCPPSPQLEAVTPPVPSPDPRSVLKRKGKKGKGKNQSSTHPKPTDETPSHPSYNWASPDPPPSPDLVQLSGPSAASRTAALAWGMPKPSFPSRPQPFSPWKAAAVPIPAVAQAPLPSPPPLREVEPNFAYVPDRDASPDPPRLPTPASEAFTESPVLLGMSEVNSQDFHSSDEVVGKAPHPQPLVEDLETSPTQKRFYSPSPFKNAPVPQHLKHSKPTPIIVQAPSQRVPAPPSTALSHSTLKVEPSPSLETVDTTLVASGSVATPIRGRHPKPIPAPKPVIIGDPCGEFMKLILAFAATLRESNLPDSRFKGARENKQSRQGFYHNLAETIRDTRPQLFPFFKSNTPSAQPAARNMRRHVWSPRPAHHRGRSRSISPPRTPSPAEKAPDIVFNGPTFYCDDIVEPERPVLFSHAAAAKKAELIEAFVERWDEPAKNCLDLVFENHKSHLAAVQALHFQKYSRELCELFSSTIDGLLEQNFESVLAKAQTIIEMEKMGFTLNDQDFTTHQNRMVAYYKGVRARQTGRPADDSVVEMLAEVQAYFEVAHKRFIDSFSLLVEFDFIQGLLSKIPDALIDAVSLGSPDARSRCNQLLQRSVPT
ncbi:hypothetical protein BOTBODRAFT_35621 [Botryobasidium botryosum FD-172 SS1]|uniref:GED domain-containing protein n=1 Tax=Botryobasidium botryosum (strain FD-172 SS1) TaxID=930990 RepID=A0A067M689_BOTB1|nr:hypothetical protein BOTBODRAFT_35621 [Botryobasidium botryosum FD-172 SS1]